MRVKLVRYQVVYGSLLGCEKSFDVAPCSLEEVARVVVRRYCCVDIRWASSKGRIAANEG